MLCLCISDIIEVYMHQQYIYGTNYLFKIAMKNC